GPQPEHQGRGGGNQGNRGNRGNAEGRNPGAGGGIEGRNEDGAWRRGRGGRAQAGGQEGPGGGGAAGGGGAPRVWKLGYRALEELAGKEPSEVAITLSSSAGLRELLEEPEMRQNMVQLLCKVLSKAVGSRLDRQIVQHLVRALKDSGFLKTVLPQYIMGMMMDPIPARRHQYPEHLDNIITLLSDLVSIFPASSIQVVSMLVTILQPAVNALRALGVAITDQTQQDLEKINELVTHLQEKRREGTLRTDTYTFLGPEEDAPAGEAGYKTMPIYPKWEEIHLNDKPFLRPNIVSRSYPSTQVYLDTHFRLLREDFVRPLREGIREILQTYLSPAEGPEGNLRKKRFDDIRVYFDTRLLTPTCTHSGTAYKVHFDTRPLKFVRWENSKRLIYGSLVCLSRDNFETFLFATVADRDPAELKKGIVLLTFTQESRPALAEVQASHAFLMVETTAYFEAYRHVLEGLQEEEEEDLPFQRYIVQCQKDVAEPAYLRAGPGAYDLSSIAAPPGGLQVPCNVLDPDAWPSMEELGLDESQLRALKLALTKELAIIQGPPGTGKTYVGLKIAQALLMNESVWQPGLAKVPVLVVCYTNHALDQFLEGIHTFLDSGIVRVGGRSNSEILKRFTLRELRGSNNFRKNLPNHLRRAYYEITSELAQAGQRIEEEAGHLECTLRGVLHEQYLERFIHEEHWSGLCHQPFSDGFLMYGQKQSLILEWLGLGNSEFQRRGGDPLQARGGNAEGENEAEEEEDEEEEEELVEVEEEAALMEAERVIEGVEPQGHDFRKRKADRAVRDLEGLLLAMSINSKEERAGQSEEGWQMQKKQKQKMKRRVKKELEKSSVMSEEEEKNTRDIWRLELSDRWRLYRLWLLRYQIEMRRKALQSEQAYQNAADRLAEIRLREDLCILKEARVIGMTTTGAAKFRRVLQEVQPRLVIVEEAAEVLEAHTITTLSRACQHLILIGDHQQLRPSATVYELAKNFNLEVSLFERLVNVDFPYVRLNYQHRMRPEIACLLTPHIYSELENHPSVLEYENIKGVSSNLFFVEHDVLEQEIQDGRSHQNKHEAQFVVALCLYLICQGYKPSQITILTTYTGQLYCLRKLLPQKQFQGVKVHVVDKYQGEENDIILLSLVRSNSYGKVGFLQIANRVCVALSRAKKGLYCIGNMALFGKVQLWSNILHTLREKGQVGRALMLSCQNHPNTRALVSQAQDFQQAPEGGCSRPCEFRLGCGHVCTRACHPYDADHKAFQCQKPCQKVLCNQGHRCPGLCFKKCQDCKVLVEKEIPYCGHKQKVPCHVDPLDFICKEPCLKTLGCGHPCGNVCGEACTDHCPVRVRMTLQCGHVQEEECHYKNKASRLGEQQPACKLKCDTRLLCSHPCPGTCHSCSQGRFHKGCLQPCGRSLICSHECKEPCTSECPPCSLPCQNRCMHSACKKTCGELCPPCVEPCEWRCRHLRCGKLCHEPCDRPPCNQPCDKPLKCGHACIGLCGEPCPSRCRVCHQEEVTEIFFGTEDEPDARYVQLEECGHLLEVTAMDHYMSLGGNEDEDVVIKLKVCPKCRTPIRKNQRYGTSINRSLEEIEKVKAQILGSPLEIEKKQKMLKRQLKEKVAIHLHLPKENESLKSGLEHSGLSLGALGILENKMVFYERLAKLIGGERDMEEEECRRFRVRVGEVLEWLDRPHLRFSEQQLSDLKSEIQRLTFLADFNMRCKQASSRRLGPEVRSELAGLRGVLEGTERFTEQDEQRVGEKLKELESALPRNGLGISEAERVMIVKAMNFPKGHWYKCPNNHVYAIGDCGGATERRHCPECNEAIGGTNHTLVSGNQVASEMDGAQHAAWSEANNLQNFGGLGFA
ncbi:NFX1-type zinc finger-containing protein 1-like, partial [Acipenser ruthenus]|uniref:NFX1-type zinc finger-containing protein 1-like n=1 Tax=Acipenser ruthenus TaxID=7906 RepID=UPI00274220BA